MEEKTKDHWLNEQIYISSGRGIGTFPDGRSVWLGKEEEIKEYLAGGALPENIGDKAIAVLWSRGCPEVAVKKVYQQALARPSDSLALHFLGVVSRSC